MTDHNPSEGVRERIEAAIAYCEQIPKALCASVSLDDLRELLRISPAMKGDAKLLHELSLIGLSLAAMGQEGPAATISRAISRLEAQPVVSEAMHSAKEG